ncbi:uncharacterized protein LOC124928236 [Impatiens glandulifera]|uniref:uncharacterized protein LOC124928236 n=1 Tax=Impatiens glandulifera TaxID=253017 RepID=UPI001FB077E5|nr:uncharacterized protein LOC124928236 [Impatiens glandulifera]
MAAWMEVDEESTNELSKLLETESVSAVRVRFIENPYSAPLIFESSTSYITINGNEEYCGSSFSDSDASVMASIDIRRSEIGFGLFTEAFRAWSSAVGSNGRREEVGGAAAGGGGEMLAAEGMIKLDNEVDEEMLAKFLLEDDDEMI